MADEVQTREDIATIRATLDGMKSVFASGMDALKEQVKHANDNASQSVLLVRERQDRQFDLLKAQLDAMDASREQAKLEQARQFEEVKLGQQTIRSEVNERLEDHDQRLKMVEVWQTRVTSKVVGIAIGVSLGSGGVAAALVKVFE